jgi:hypothetical protein
MSENGSQSQEVARVVVSAGRSTAARRLDDEREREHSWSVLRSIFASLDPFDEPVSESFPDRLIAFPIAYRFSEDQWETLVKCVNELGEERFLAFAIEGTMDAWEAELTPYPYYQLYDLGWPLGADNALCSTVGSWGIIVSHEWHAIIAGKREFIDALRFSLPEAGMNAVEEMLEGWLRLMAKNGTQEEVRPLLAHVYGREAGDELFLRVLSRL